MLALLLFVAASADAQDGRHWISIAARPGGAGVSYAYAWSPRWSLVASAGARRDREVVNIFVGREGCICNSHYRDFETTVWSYSAGVLAQRDFVVSKHWILYAAAGAGYIRGPGRYSLRLHRLESSSGRFIQEISFDPQLVARTAGGVAFRMRPHVRLAMEVDVPFGAEKSSLVDYRRPSLAFRLAFTPPLRRYSPHR